MLVILLIKNLWIMIILLWLNKMKQIIALLNLKLMIESESHRSRIFLVKVTLKIGQEKYLLSILFWKLIQRHIKFKWRKNNGKFSWKIIVFWVYYKCIINQKNLDHATRFDKSDLATKSNFIALKAEVGKLEHQWTCKCTNKVE